MAIEKNLRSELSAAAGSGLGRLLWRCNLQDLLEKQGVRGAPRCLAWLTGLGGHHLLKWEAGGDALSVRCLGGEGGGRQMVV